MPRLLMFATPTALLNRIYTIDEPVGARGANRPKDVLLVQFFLASAQRKPEISGGVTRDYSKDTSGKPLPMRIDGVYGPQTLTAIKRFQDVYDAGVELGSVAAMIHDALIEPMTSSGFGPRQSHIMSISRLNMLYRSQFGEDAHAKLFNDALFPAQLRSEFFVH